MLWLQGLFLRQAQDELWMKPDGKNVLSAVLWGDYPPQKGLHAL